MKLFLLLAQLHILPQSRISLLCIICLKSCCSQVHIEEHGFLFLMLFVVLLQRCKGMPQSGSLLCYLLSPSGLKLLLTPRTETPNVPLPKAQHVFSQQNPMHRR